MSEHEDLVKRFEEHRGHLRAVAYRMLGSLAEADDAVQEAWLKLDQADTSEVRNLGGWLTTVVGRVCLNMLRSRATRREESLDARVNVPDPIVSRTDRVDPEHQVLLGDSVGLAMLVVLDTLAPAERLAFVLHDLFAVPFDEIAPIVRREPAATRQLASRARRRVQGVTPEPAVDLSRQRQLVDAFFAASRDGDFDALVSVLHPDVDLRADAGPLLPSVMLRGAEVVAGQALMFSKLAPYVRPAMINGGPGAVAVRNGKPFSLGSFTIRDGKIAAIVMLTDPDRLRKLDLSVLN
jgi:RNA polymerase sigma-70 factor, ECF subfamily